MIMDSWASKVHSNSIVSYLFHSNNNVKRLPVLPCMSDVIHLFGNYLNLNNLPMIKDAITLTESCWFYQLLLSSLALLRSFIYSLFHINCAYVSFEYLPCCLSSFWTIFAMVSCTFVNCTIILADIIKKIISFYDVRSQLQTLLLRRNIVSFPHQRADPMKTTLLLGRWGVGRFIPLWRFWLDNQSSWQHNRV